jgi:hypothetical protein
LKRWGQFVTVACPNCRQQVRAEWGEDGPEREEAKRCEVCGIGVCEQCSQIIWDSLLCDGCAVVRMAFLVEEGAAEAAER